MGEGQSFAACFAPCWGLTEALAINDTLLPVMPLPPVTNTEQNHTLGCRLLRLRQPEALSRRWSHLRFCDPVMMVNLPSRTGRHTAKGPLMQLGSGLTLQAVRWCLRCGVVCR